MRYQKIVPGIFRLRPNRFIAHVETSEGLVICHVKNTGRCQELLIDGAKVYLEESKNPARKTKFDLVAVEKGSLLINMDSQAPNKAAAEYLPTLLPDLTLLRPETRFGNSRFDFYAEAAGERWFIEVKGVTLEREGVALFPDAPTLRGTKHLRELCQCLDQGYRACILFIIQMTGVDYFSPNTETDPDFSAALKEAAERGVQLAAMDCLVTPCSMTVRKEIAIHLHN
ncbi:DNA/RNA nuclease SfsA [Acutalibacter sp. 1XD8-33]|uniref:DNA/RNA nuclease SfsA n=1 Tax=Acutalibacter sp. 1XD8-33 TaxID=2320081 RepID=UPI000EA10DE4|nr:DNA/RNA nuclease SfsA [Acutalibacter sp. 1XD8-33]RKJ38931.1 DNA/RNA nuclease SfsA [Acutalibacter sp. 1XD8-33]